MQSHFKNSKIIRFTTKFYSLLTFRFGPYFMRKFIWWSFKIKASIILQLLKRDGQFWMTNSLFMYFSIQIQPQFVIINFRITYSISIINSLLYIKYHKRQSKMSTSILHFKHHLFIFIFAILLILYSNTNIFLFNIFLGIEVTLNQSYHVPTINQNNWCNA